MSPDTTPFPDQPAPESFLKHFPDHWVQFFDDGPAPDGRKALTTPHFDRAEAGRKQAQGCGVFFSPNGFDGVRRIENLKHVQAVYVDLDLAKEGDGTPAEVLEKRLGEGLRELSGFALPPHAVIRTKHGLHAVWRVEPLPAPGGLALFRETTDLLVARFGADPAARDVTRVLRLPGYLHLKDPASPFLCRLVIDRLAESPYRLTDVFAALGGRQATPPALPQPPARAPEAWAAAAGGVDQGGRNSAAASYAGKVLSALPVEVWAAAGWGALKEWNGLNRPPLPEAELRSVFDSIAKRERASRSEGGTRAGGNPDQTVRAQADRLIALTGVPDTTLFCDQFGEPHAHVHAGEGHRTMKVWGSEFRQWLAQRFWRAERRACGSEAVSAAVNTLAGRTRFEGRRVALECRVAWHGGAIWYDLADGMGRAVRVDAAGWAVVERPPILFRRYAQQQPQGEPVRGRPLSDLLGLVNLAEARRGPLLLVYLVTCFIPDIPHPVGVVCGPQGAAKSTLCRMLRRLIDPNVLEGLALPKRDDLPQLLSHHWFCAFDNVSAVKGDVSDVLCRAVTGDGVSRRRLYSDDEDVVYQFRRCVCLNGINLASARPDLLDRSILFPLERIPASRCREESAVLAEFEALRPELLGAVFDALAGAMRLRPTVEAGPLPRMADFARWGAAVAESLGLGAREFGELYRENIRELREEAIAESPVAGALGELMATRDRWSGTASDLLSALTGLRGGPQGAARAGLPRRPNALMKQLNVIRTDLAQGGILIDTSRRTAWGRRIEVRRAEPMAALRATPSANRPDDDRPAGELSPSSRPSPRVPQAEATPAPGDDRDDAAAVLRPGNGLVPPPPGPC